MLRLKSDQLEEIKKIAEEAYPHECCGVLAGASDGSIKTVLSLIPAENQRTDSPANRYLIAPEFLHGLEKQLRGAGKDIVGFFHSHPDVAARPSEYDREHAWPWFSYIIVSVRQRQAGEVLNWRLKEDRSAFEPEDLEVFVE